MAAAAAPRPPSIQPHNRPTVLVPAEELQSHGNWFALSTREKQNFFHHDEGEYALPGHPLMPVVERIALRVPECIAPNALALAGMICLLLAQCVANFVGTGFVCPSTCEPVANFVCLLLVGGYCVLRSVTSIHARRIKNKSNVGLLVTTAADAAAPCFLVPTLCINVGIVDAQTQWHAVQATQLLFLFIHLWELRNDSCCGIRWLFPGPAAIVPVFALGRLLLLAVKGSVGLDSVATVTAPWRAIADGVMTAVHSTQLFGPFELSTWIHPWDSQSFSRDTLSSFVTLYILSIVMVAVAALRPWPETVHDASGAQCCVLIVILHRIVLFALADDGLGRGSFSILTAIEDGLVIGLLITEGELCRMALRRRRPWRIAFLCAGCSMLQGVTVITSAAYHVTVFADLCRYARLPMLTPARNVYIDGVWDQDGCEVILKAAAKLGNRLVVGVLSAEDAERRGQRTELGLMERCLKIRQQKCVVQIIANAPCRVNVDFLNHHQIHVVAGQDDRCADD
eukprot:TRINITY_DN10544_c0_g1_i2.p1 TRINITY_DN10544_c0_g1~~TRINITY_DN10544_c0_g1_i2.p1  ORF type:complete len:511 (+),score=123.32 TRINITY_DN10544_c0_g1_i2:105-1637(+)